MKACFVTLAMAGLIAIASAALVVWGGLYDVSATGAHTRPVHQLLEVAMHRSVRLRAADIETPELTSQPLIMRGAACFRDWCVQCHGGPAIAPGPVGMSLQPLPGSLVDAARRWHPREMYWITRHGIKMSGMPAWQFRLSDDDIWAVTAFLTRLPALSPRQYESMSRSQAASGPCQTLQGACAHPPCPPPKAESTVAQLPPAAMLFRQYACTACHGIPGVAGPDVHVGPSLNDFARRSLIAGRLPNTEDDLVRWIRFPRQVDPETAMPDSGVTEAHATVMARYLLRDR